MYAWSRAVSCLMETTILVNPDQTCADLREYPPLHFIVALVSGIVNHSVRGNRRNELSAKTSSHIRCVLNRCYRGTHVSE